MSGNVSNRIIRHEVEEEISKSRILEAMAEGGTEEEQRLRINQALQKPIEFLEVKERWKTMKEQRAAGKRSNLRRKEVNENMLKELRNFDADRTDLDEMVALSTFGRSMKVEYERLAMPIPEWIEDRTRTLDSEIRSQRRDALEKKVKELQSRKDALKTAEQKRQDVDAELEKVKAALGQTA